MTQSRSYEAGNNLTQKGAMELLEKIIDFWKDKGKEIKAWVEPFTVTTMHRAPMWQIRSNLKRGLPE